MITFIKSLCYENITASNYPCQYIFFHIRITVTTFVVTHKERTLKQFNNTNKSSIIYYSANYPIPSQHLIIFIIINTKPIQDTIRHILGNVIPIILQFTLNICNFLFRHSPLHHHQSNSVHRCIYLDIARLHLI